MVDYAPVILLGIGGAGFIWAMISWPRQFKQWEKEMSAGSRPKP